MHKDIIFCRHGIYIYLYILFCIVLGTEDLPGNTQENYEDMIQRISTLLLEKKYREAVSLLRKADHVAGNAELRCVFSKHTV